MVIGAFKEKAKSVPLISAEYLFGRPNCMRYLHLVFSGEMANQTFLTWGELFYLFIYFTTFLPIHCKYVV